MPRVGRKMMITGKGRCNLTSADDIPSIVEHIVGNGRFLSSVLRSFDNTQVMAFFQEQGVPLKVERGNRVFPQSDRAVDIVDAMIRRLYDLCVGIRTSTAAENIMLNDSVVRGVQLSSGEHVQADAVILATGGASYPLTGSSGDGYVMARRTGHHVTPVFPALVPLIASQEWVKDVQGLSLRNVRATLFHAGKKVQECFGEMIFTHFGVTGPIILSMSRCASQLLLEGAAELALHLNLKPALTHEKLRARIDRDFALYRRKQLCNGMKDLLPQRLINIVLAHADLSPASPVGQVSAKARERLVHTLHALPLTIIGTRPLSEAIVTAGGIDTREIHPRTMESKHIRGLYFAGEVVDVDGFTGGYNLQAAFSMGHAAGCYSVWNLESE